MADFENMGERVDKRLHEIMMEIYEIVGVEPPEDHHLAGTTIVVHFDHDTDDDGDAVMTVPFFLFAKPPSLQRVYDARNVLDHAAQVASAQLN